MWYNSYLLIKKLYLCTRCRYYMSYTKYLLKLLFKMLIKYYLKQGKKQFQFMSVCNFKNAFWSSNGKEGVVSNTMIFSIYLLSYCAFISIKTSSKRDWVRPDTTIYFASKHYIYKKCHNVYFIPSHCTVWGLMPSSAYSLGLMLLTFKFFYFYSNTNMKRKLLQTSSWLYWYSIQSLVVL